MDWKSEARRELNKAKKARLAGNEGRARVCARRAAGYIVGEYLLRRAQSDPGPSAYARLQFLLSLPDLPQKTREIAAHFVIRTTPEFTLPVEADLIDEVGQLSDKLVGESLE
jgi:hypothetical protein